MTQYWYSCIVSLTVCNFVIFYAVLRLFAQCWTFKIQFGTFLSQNQNLAYFLGEIIESRYQFSIISKIIVIDLRLTEIISDLRELSAKLKTTRKLSTAKKLLIGTNNDDYYWHPSLVSKPMKLIHILESDSGDKRHLFKDLG